MKKYTHPAVVWIIIAVLILATVSCSKLVFNTNSEIAQDIHQKLLNHNIKEIPIEEVTRLLNRPSSNPCVWDFNFNGAVDVDDLQIVLSEFGLSYNVNDLADFLGDYGEEYIVDVVPLWNNYIQDINCNLDWDAFHRVKCSGMEYLYVPLEDIAVEWLYTDLNYGVQDSLVSTNPYKLDWYTYGNNGSCNEFDSFQPLCNGAQTITCRIYMNGEVYERTNVGVARINIPDSIGIFLCDNLYLYEEMESLISGYSEYEYLIE
jgi:hypothetical protein